jgi:orotidine-5'-phosphate decarboxylase
MSSLSDAVRRVGNPLVVGLDPRFASLPAPLRDGGNADDLEHQARCYATFCREIIDVVCDSVPAVKPQAAFFEALGPAGMSALGEVICHAQDAGLLVVLDGKRNDIGSTAAGYADAWLGRDGASAWGADALTISPYLGDDSLTPFVDVAVARNAGLFVLVKTSNPGGGTFQDLVADGRPLYRHVAALVEQMSSEHADAEHSDGCQYGPVGAVVGATYPQQLDELRAAMPHTWFLVPGFGSQGGTAADVAGAFDDAGLGAIVNSSRGIIFAHSRPAYAERFGDARWQDAVAAATADAIAQLRADTPAGKLPV